MNSDILFTVPRVGVGVIIVNDEKVLIGERIGTVVGTNKFAFPGGHLEFGESLEECAIRETKEETGLDIENVKVGAIENTVMDDIKRHYVTVFMTASLKDKKQQPEVLEKNKCLGWNWYEWTEIPKPTFSPLAQLIEHGYKPELHCT